MSMFTIPIQSNRHGQFFAVVGFPEEWFDVFREQVKAIPEPHGDYRPQLCYPMSPGVRFYKRSKFTDDVIGAVLEHRPYDDDPFGEWFWDNEERLHELPFPDFKTLEDSLRLAGSGENFLWRLDAWINETVLLRDGSLSLRILITSRDAESSVEMFDVQLQPEQYPNQ